MASLIDGKKLLIKALAKKHTFDFQKRNSSLLIYSAKIINILGLDTYYLVFYVNHTK